MNSELPKIESKKCSEIYKLLKEMIPYYTPEWAGSDSKDAGVALLKIFSQMNEGVINHLNQAPKKNFVAFLDMLGIELLPAQPARALLTFKLANGIKTEILIPQGTQVSAKKAEGIKTEIPIPERTPVSVKKESENEEILFETEKDLLAIPSQLKTVVSVDPEQDAIYFPPPSFLNGEKQKQNKITYKIKTYTSVGSDNFQLDNVTDLKPGDFLCIDDKESVIISTINGMIVHITSPLSKDYPEETNVKKITKFKLFSGKNRQEHSIYLGDKDLFNIKSTANFTLFVSLRAGTERFLSPLKASWEYWGEVKGEESEDWHKFDLGDNTDGLSKDGTVTLSKTKEGEIKEKEINGVKSKWIRCILTDPLGIGASLPILDNITFDFHSLEEEIASDQAFHNDKPIDVTKPFAPFGYEPRVFDTFLIASNEAFSKRSSKITIDIEVEKRGILGGPTAIIYKSPASNPNGSPTANFNKDATSNKNSIINMKNVFTKRKSPTTSSIDDNIKNTIRVFARGTSGRLIEVEIDPDGKKNEIWTDHGFPPDKIAFESTPSAFAHSFPPDTKIASESTHNNVANKDFITVFARTENGHLVERFYNGVQWQWIDHGTPSDKLTDHGTPSNNISVLFDPFSIYTYDAVAIVSAFIVGSDGNLYEFYRDLNSMDGQWLNRGKLSETPLASSPFAASFDSRVMVFARGEDRHLYKLDCSPGIENSKKWYDYGMPASDVNMPTCDVNVYSRPFAVVHQETNNEMLPFVKVYVKGLDGALWKLNVCFGKPNDWKRLGVPPSNTKIKSDPHGGHVENKEENRILIIGDDNSLWEYKDNINKPCWIPHQSPANSKLCFSPFVIPLDGKLNIFSASNKNSILERISNKEKLWNEYKDPDEISLSPVLSWEYWNNKGWVVIKGINDGTANFLKDGKITFDLPEDIGETEVSGQKGYWIRVRLISGDYGKEKFVLLEDSSNGTSKQQLISTKNSIRPPIINNLALSYSFEESLYLDKTLTYNNLEYVDQTEANKENDKFFYPFAKLEDNARTFYLGFENSFKYGPIKIYFAASELPFKEESKPKLEWTYSTINRWNELAYQDATEGLIKADILEFLMGLDFSAKSQFGSYLYWIKGKLTKGKYEDSPILDGIYPNTTWTLQTATFKDEILGSSDGKANQRFSFRNPPVFPGEIVRVNEILSEEEKQTIIALSGESAIFEVKDEKGKVVENWVLWSKVSDFFDSTMQDRSYVLDRTTGQLQFGDGINGKIPQALDDNIKVFSYKSGGGNVGNVGAGEIKSLKSTIAGVESVSNLIAADGGADAADFDQMLEIGPSMISHRDRAVTAEDFEWLVKETYRKVAKVKCLPNTNREGKKEIGWVTLIIVPNLKEDKPLPSLELRNEVLNYLGKKCENTLAYEKRINIDSPSYIEISVSVDVFVTSIDKTFTAESEVKRKLDAFFHPLTGGSEQKGWDFGRRVSDSDIYALLEKIDGVDHVENLEIKEKPCSKELVKAKENYLVANGTHTIKPKLVGESDFCGSA